MASAILVAISDGFGRTMPLHAGSAPSAMGGKYLNQSCFRSCHSARPHERADTNHYLARSSALRGELGDVALPIASAATD